MAVSCQCIEFTTANGQDKAGSITSSRICLRAVLRYLISLKQIPAQWESGNFFYDGFSTTIYFIKIRQTSTSITESCAGKFSCALYGRISLILLSRLEASIRNTTVWNSRQNNTIAHTAVIFQSNCTAQNTNPKKSSSRLESP